MASYSLEAEEHQREALIKEEEPIPLDVQRELARLTAKDERRLAELGFVPFLFTDVCFLAFNFNGWVFGDEGGV